MGQFKRTIKKWKDDIQNVWGRLNTFHRIALGITLAMIMIYAARVKVLDPLQAEITRKHKAMDEKGIPMIVPSADKDDDLQKSLARLESLNERAPQIQRQLEETLRQKPQINPTNRSEVLSEFELLIIKSGMILQKRSLADEESQSLQAEGKHQAPRDETQKRNLPLKTWTYTYELTGTFQSVCDCLREIGTFRYPARLSRVEILAASDETGPHPFPHTEPRILLRFELELYYHEQ